MNTNSNIDNYAFTPHQIDAAYINSLVNLVNICRELNVKLDTVQTFQNGWRVTFEGFEGDAICHDHSYGSPCYGGIFDNTVHTNDWSRSGSWETINFPWDNDDVSVHNAETLVHMIAALRDGSDWKQYEDS